MEADYLPIGSVVLLKGTNKRIMISGFCAMPEDFNGKIYDYSGYIYPEGAMSSEEVYLFDHNQIEKVFFKGYVDEEETAFKKKINSIIESGRKDALKILEQLKENNNANN